MTCLTSYTQKTDEQIFPDFLVDSRGKTLQVKHIRVVLEFTGCTIHVLRVHDVLAAASLLFNGYKNKPKTKYAGSNTSHFDRLPNSVLKMISRAFSISIKQKSILTELHSVGIEPAIWPTNSQTEP